MKVEELLKKAEKKIAKMRSKSKKVGKKKKARHNRSNMEYDRFISMVESRTPLRRPEAERSSRPLLRQRSP